MLARIGDYIARKVRRIKWKFRPDAYAEFLRGKGMKIGDNVFFAGINTPAEPLIDLTRPTLVEIGSNVYINEYFTLFTHDYVAKNFIELYNDFLPSSGRVKIGNNVSFGSHVTVLKGVEIGDNTFIAAGSLVTKDIPPGCVAAGRPAKPICPMDEYYSRRKKECIGEALAYARSIKDRLGRMPVAKDFWEEFPLFVDRHNIDEYPEIPVKAQLGDRFDSWLAKHKAPFDGLEDFLDAAFNGNHDPHVRIHK